MVVVYLSINYSPLMKPLEIKPNKRNLYSMVIFANKKIALLIKTVGFINLNLGLEVVAVTW